VITPPSDTADYNLNKIAKELQEKSQENRNPTKQTHFHTATKLQVIFKRNYSDAKI
jgi:hypothetical protein